MQLSSACTIFEFSAIRKNGVSFRKRYLKQKSTVAVFSIVQLFKHKTCLHSTRIFSCISSDGLVGFWLEFTSFPCFSGARCTINGNGSELYPNPPHWEHAHISDFSNIYHEFWGFHDFWSVQSTILHRYITRNKFDRDWNLASWIILNETKSILIFTVREYLLLIAAIELDHHKCGLYIFYVWRPGRLADDMCELRTRIHQAQNLRCKMLWRFCRRLTTFS